MRRCLPASLLALLCARGSAWVREHVAWLGLLAAASVAAVSAHAAPERAAASRQAAVGALQAASAPAAPASGPASMSTQAFDADPLSALMLDKGLLLPSAPLTVMRNVRDAASDLVFSAMNFLGVPYRRGGSSAESGFDCSGFTRHVFEMSLGLVLPRRADEQAKSSGLMKVDRDELKPGDLVFFNTMRRAFSHVGIYVGDGKFIHSPRTGGNVRVESLREAYWQKRFNGARRTPKLENTGSTGIASAAPSAVSVPGLVPLPATATAHPPFFAEQAGSPAAPAAAAPRYSPAAPLVGAPAFTSPN